jgi:hypothetical protein
VFFLKCFVARGEGAAKRMKGGAEKKKRVFRNSYHP